MVWFEQVSVILLKGADGEVTPPIIRSPVPVFATVTDKVEELPTFTLPKLRAVGFTSITGVAVLK